LVVTEGGGHLAGGNFRKDTAMPRSVKFEAFVDEAKGLMANGRWLDAISRLAESVKVARQENRPDLEVLAYVLIGEALRKKGDNDKAGKYLQKAIDLATSKDDHLGLARTYNEQAALHVSTGDRDSAMKALTSAQECAERARADGLKGSILSSMAQLMADGGDLAKAVETYRKAIDVLERTEGEDANRALAKACNGLANALETSGEHARALTFFERAKEEFLKCGDVHGRALSVVGVAECCARLGFTVRALEQLEAARNDLMKLNDNAGLGEVYRISGALMIIQSNWNAAKRHLDKAVSLFTPEKDRPRNIAGLVRTYAEIGRMHRTKGDAESASASFKDARELAQRSGSKGLVNLVEKIAAPPKK